MEKKVLKTVVKAVIVGALCCPVLEGAAQAQVKATKKFFRDVHFSSEGRERIHAARDSACVGIPINVKVKWNKHYLREIVFDSACFVYKLSPEEQQRTGKKEILIRDMSFTSRAPTPEEIEAGEYTCTANPQKSVVYFFTQYWQQGFGRNIKSSFYHPIKIVDNKGKELIYKK